jgi:GMP synthase-like glutamine amidotransferase
MKPVRIFRHEDWVHAGRLTQFLNARSIPWALVRIDQGEPVHQTIDDVAGLAFLGGTMSVNDGLPWQLDELALIRKATAEDVPMLGHCLGSQLIAMALGGVVAPMPDKEIGWWQMSHCDNVEARAWLQGVPNPVEILAWHHEAFTLPPGTSPLYSSPFCADQAYVRGNTVATVAHPEVTPELLESWLHLYGYDIEPTAPSVQSIEQIREDLPRRCVAMHAAFTDRIYETWLSRVAAYAQAQENAAAPR